MKGLLDNDELSFMYFDKLYDLKINGILEDTYQNGYSDNGNKIVYIPVSKFNELFSDSVEPYLYILRFDNSVDFNKVVEQIKNIDNEITIYSTIDIDKLQLLNSQLLAGVENIVKAIMACIIVLIIYDKSKLIISRKHELALLYANGLSKKEIIKILFIESLDYSIYALVAANIVSVVILLLFYDCTFNTFISIVILNAILFISLNFIMLVVSNYLLNRFSIKALLEE